MDKNTLREMIKKMAESYYMPVYEPKVKDQYDNTPYEERRVIMTTVFYPEDYAVYNYGELPTKIQTAVNNYFNGRGLSEETDTDTGGQRLALSSNIVVKFKNEDEAAIAADGLKDVNNYGKYINQFQTLDPGLKKHLSDTFGPSIPSQKKAALKKRREELGDENFEFKTKTGQAIIDAIKDYFENKPSKSIITFKVTDKNELFVPIEQNIFTKQNLKDILKTVFTNIGLKGFEISEKEGLDETQMKEDIDLGHQDDEPDMLKASVYRIAKYAAELYKMLDKYDQMNAEVDFPDWWQEKIHLAKDYMVKAKHYLDFEEKQPALDASISEEAVAGKIDFNIPMSANPTAKKLARLLYKTDADEVVNDKIKLSLGGEAKKIQLHNPGAKVYEFADEPQGVKYAAVMVKTFKLFDSALNLVNYRQLKEDITPTTMDMNQTDMLDTLIRKYMDQYVDTRTDDFVDRYGDDAEKVMYGAAVKRAEQDMEERGLPVDEKNDPVGKEDDDVNNDGKVDKTDKYLLNKRKAIAASIAKKIKK